MANSEVKIKICGNTNLCDAELAHKLGADFLGFIFAKSKRQITAVDAKQIMKAMPRFGNFVGVFANQPKHEVEKIAGDLGLTWLQFHGDETSRYCDYFLNHNYRVIKTFRIKDRLSLKRLDEYNVTSFLFDAYSKQSLGGTGETFDWSVIEDKAYVHDRLFLAGGLTAGNVAQAIQTVHPYAVDVASGVEREPGVKDPQLLEMMIKLVKGSG